MVNIFLLSSFLTVTIFPILGYVIISLFFFFVLSLFMIGNNNKILLFPEDKNVIYLFYLFFFSSFAVVGFFSIFICGMSYIEFYPAIVGRLTNITLFFTLFLFIINGRNHSSFSTNDMLNAYFKGCCILLFFGIWQLLNNLFGVPYPNWTTRDSIHSMNTSTLLPFMAKRITSIAREPAYLIPYLIDAVILLCYKSRNYLLILLYLIILFFTLSLSAYVNVFLIGMIMLVVSQRSKRKVIICFVVILIGFWMIYQLKDVFIAVFDRLDPQNLFLSTRLRVIILSIKYMFSDISLFNNLFGFGPKGMGYIRKFVFYPSGYLQGGSIARTTNTVFFDFFVEHGVVGLLMIIMLFFRLYKMGIITYRKTKNRLSQLLCLNLFITSFYTADFASPRFTIIIIFILCLYKDALSQNVVLNID